MKVSCIIGVSLWLGVGFAMPDEIDDFDLDSTETVSKDNLDPSTVMDSERMQWQGLNSPAPQSIHTDNLGDGTPQSVHQSRTSKVMNESTWTNNLDEPAYPISASEFLE